MARTIFAIRLKEARTKAGIKQTELARIVHVTPVTISSYERADTEGSTIGKNPSLENALKIARALHVSLDWLCGNDAEGAEAVSVPVLAQGQFSFAQIAQVLEAVGNVDASAYEPYDEATVADNGTAVLGDLAVTSTVVHRFLLEYKKVAPILQDDSYPEALKESIRKTVLDKFKDFYLEDGKIYNAEDPEYSDLSQAND